MKAFRVYYDTPSKSNSMIVLAETKDDVPSMLANKDRGFKIGGRYKDLYRIGIVEEMPLSNVMVSDLSVTELLMLLKGDSEE